MIADAIAIAAAAVVNAFGRRFAGGLAAQWAGHKLGGTQVARAMQASLAGATVAVLAPAWWWSVPAALATFAGATAGFGRVGMLPRTWRDVGMLAVVHGAVALAPLALVIGALWAWAGLWERAALAAATLMVAGLARGPIYWAAQQWQPHVPALGLNPDGIPDPPPWAEFWCGAVLGAALWCAV